MIFPLKKCCFFVVACVVAGGDTPWPFATDP